MSDKLSKLVNKVLEEKLTQINEVKKNTNNLISVNADWKDFEGFIDELIPVLNKLGLYAIDDPLLEGSDQWGILISKKPITHQILKTYMDEFNEPWDDNNELDENIKLISDYDKGYKFGYEEGYSKGYDEGVASVEMNLEESELNEMARISTSIKINDPKKASAAKKLYNGSWIASMIEAVEKAGDKGISQPDLAKQLGKSGMQAINPKVRELMSSGVFKMGELTKDKKIKPPTSGVKGRPTKTTDEINFEEPSEYNYEEEREDVLTENEEDDEKEWFKLKDEVMDEWGYEDEDLDEESIENDVNRETDNRFEEKFGREYLGENKPINESFLHMQKLAGVITKAQYKEKTKK